MATHEEIVAAQSGHRHRLLESWPVQPGSKILEIGCGQGDMTEVLATAVGLEGRITAVDIASDSYGAPLTLKEATNLLLDSDLGDRIEFRFNFDTLSPDVDFPDRTFDAIVMAHSSWYFASPDQLLRTISRIRPWTSKLFFAEWDLQPYSPDQIAHFLAVNIQGQVEAFRAESESNVRTPLSKYQFKETLKVACWEIVAETTIDSPSLQDADWEVSMCLDGCLKHAAELNLNDRFLSHIQSQLDLLRQVARKKGNTPLSCYSLVAENTNQ